MAVILIKLFLLLVFILLVIYFSSIETALLSLPENTASKIREKYPNMDKYLSLWSSKPDNILTAILVGSNFVNIGAGVLSASLAVDLKVFWGSISLLIVPVLVTLAIIFFGEIIPKIYSRYNFEKVSAHYVPSIVNFSNLITPLSNILVNISKNIMIFLHIYGKNEAPYFTKGDLKIILNQDSNLYIELPKYEKQIIKNILSFSERKVREVMIPRTDIFATDCGLKLDGIIRQMAASKYSRIPVFKESIDNIIGIIYTNDLAVVLQEKKLISVEDLIRPVYFVPENVLVRDLLREFKLGRHHLAIVVDEYGITQGLVTIEDLVEEIVGEIYDEYDIREKNIIELPGNVWFIKATESINAVNEALNTGIETTDTFSTIGGWVLTLFGHIPFPGDKTEYKNLLIEIVDSDTRKINKIRITKK